jgi:hypothetical protein
MPGSRVPGIILATTGPGGGACARRRRWAAVGLVVLLAASAGCATGLGDGEAARRAWAERDAERQRECRQARGGWIAGGCVFGGGP